MVEIEKKAIEFENWVMGLEKKGIKVLKTEDGVEFILLTSHGKVKVRADVFSGNIYVYSAYIGKEKFKAFLNEISEILGTKRIRVIAVDDIEKRITNLENWLSLPRKGYQWWEIKAWEQQKKS